MRPDVWGSVIPQIVKGDEQFESEYKKFQDAIFWVSLCLVASFREAEPKLNECICHSIP